MARVSPQEGAFWARYYWYIVDSFIYLEISRSMIFFIFQTCHLVISTWAAFWFFSNFPKIRFVLAWWAHPMYSEPTLSNFSEDRHWLKFVWCVVRMEVVSAVIAGLNNWHHFFYTKEAKNYGTWIYYIIHTFSKTFVVM